MLQVRVVGRVTLRLVDAATPEADEVIRRQMDALARADGGAMMGTMLMALVFTEVLLPPVLVVSSSRVHQVRLWRGRPDLCSVTGQRSGIIMGVVEVAEGHVIIREASNLLLSPRRRLRLGHRCLHLRTHRGCLEQLWRRYVLLLELM